MAKGTNLGVWLDLQNHPLGTGKGENFNVPTNYAIPPARIYVVNHSRTHEWMQVVIPVSAQRGAEEALIYDKELAKIYNVDTLNKRIEQGKDMNRYKKVINPVIFSFKVGAPQGTLKGCAPPIVYAIPPARDKDTPPPRVELVEGAWDLFLGNYARMQGYAKYSDMDVKEPDPTIKSDEVARHSIRWRQRHNPVFRFTDDGVTTEGNNSGDPKFGFLEFIRETAKPVVEQMDREYLAALDLVEAS